MEIPPGEGERRAQRGYVPQYDLGAALIYEALAAGRLRWIGVADRDAGSFDDIVLGLTDRIHAYQVKTSRDPAPFSIDTLLLGAENLIGRMIEARRRIESTSRELNIVTIYVCDDFPRIDDSVGDPKQPISSAAYLRAHEAHRLSWTISDWRTSPYGTFVAEVQKHTGLSDSEFEIVWRNTQFRTGGIGRLAGLGNLTPPDIKRINEIAAVLPKLVADSSDRDRWSREQLLERLQWKDPFGLRHGHSFPVDALYQSNERTQILLSKALDAVASGYLSLVGPPGSGKSTQLAAGLLPTARAHIIRYLAYVPGTGQGLGRGEAFDFLHDVITQFKQHHFGEHIIPGSELPELRKQLELLFDEASKRFRKEGVKTIIVVDGLDHVPREERPQESFLRELPLPISVPAGVVLVLGTQRVDLADLPPSVVDQASEHGRKIRIAALDSTAVARLAELAGVPEDVSRDELYARTEGHPLSIRYIIDGLLLAQNAEARKEWLLSGPAYGGNVDVFYQRAWHDLRGNSEAERGMAYLALIEGSINPANLDLMIGSAATDAVWKAAGHLLRRDRANNWSVFHNSFRLFLQNQTSLRHGVPDQSQLRNRYLELAAMAQKAECCDHQRWMELRYRARALEHGKVKELATAVRFRRQFVEGRNPDDIQADIRLTFQSAKVLRDPQLLLDLILASHELNMRAEALGEDVLRAFIYLKDFRAARSVLDAVRDMEADKGFELVEALLSAGEPDEARELFEALEPIDKLLGSEQLHLPVGSDGLEEWARVALVFREPQQVMASIARLRGPDHPFGEGIDQYKTKLKLTAAQGQIERNPDLSVEGLAAALEIEDSNTAMLLFLAARSGFNWRNKKLLLNRLEACSLRIADLSAYERRELCKMAFAVQEAELSRLFIEEVQAPTLEQRQLSYNDDHRRFVSRQVILHASLRSRLRLPPNPGSKPTSSLFANYQSRLEWLGRVHGESLLRPAIPPFSLTEFGQFLDFLQRAQGTDRPDFDRGTLTRVMDEAVKVMAEVAGLAGPENLRRFTELLDSRLENSPGPLGVPSVRRAYARAVFRHDRDSSAAKRRIDYRPGGEETPAIAFSEAALAAQTLTFVGLPDEARSVLEHINEHGVGYSKRAKHDPQYLFWEDFLRRANDEDPIGRLDRVRFFARLVRGLAETEGAGAAYRIVGTLMQEAARVGPAMAASVFNLIEECNLSNWPDIVWAFGLGTSKEHPALAEVAATIIGRLAVPFKSGLNRDDVVELVRSLPSNQFGHGVQRILDNLEVDAPIESRILAIESVVDAAAERGLNCGTEALKRWRSELPPPKSGNSPEDPFFNLRTIHEIAVQLAKSRDTSDAYGARAAFLKVAHKADYDEARSLLFEEKVLHGSEDVLDAFARLAIAKGRTADVATLLARLKALADERGSWGGAWSGKAKQLYFRLLRDSGAKDARSVAFDEFVDDMAQGREIINLLLPELGSIFEVISPNLPWRVAWDRLASHLFQFREYKHTADIADHQGSFSGGEHVIADILIRAIETTSSPLIRMARTAAVEIAKMEGGPSILGVLLPRLLQRGNAFALEAGQIAWESRSVQALKAVLASLIPTMATADDIAVRQIGMAIAQEWELSLPDKEGDLPLTYRLSLPNAKSLEKFEEPSGFSASSTGLFTDDAATWTWILETPLKIARDATGFDVANLRFRAAQLMRRNGGEKTFGPEVVKRQMTKLRQLELHTRYWKLMSSAAFQAMREVVGELAAAGAIDPRAIPVIAVESGSYPPTVPTLPPVKRGSGIPAVSPPEIFSFDDQQKWVESVTDDLILPQAEGFVVLAAIATHKREFREQTWRVEQYYGPSSEEESGELYAHLRKFPHALALEEIKALKSSSKHRVVIYVDPTVSGSITTSTPMLSPIIARELGWQADPDDAFTFFTRQGDRAAQTVYWRDGGIPASEVDHSVHRYGYVVLVTPKHWPKLRPYVANDYELRAWRQVQRSAKEAPIRRAARRKEVRPSPS